MFTFNLTFEIRPASTGFVVSLSWDCDSTAGGWLGGHRGNLVSKMGEEKGE